MAIVLYQCDVCKREIELQRNIEGLETIGRCVITQGCRGSLYQTDLFPDYLRGQIPDDVSGLDNWVQRKVLFNHAQAIERDQWIIAHNMGTAPIVSVFVDRPIEGDLDNREEITPDDVIYQTDDIVVLNFSRPYSGIAQLVGRQSDPNLLRPFERLFTTEAPPIQISNNGEISIATLTDVDLGSESISVGIQYNTESGTSPQVLYGVDDQPSINSAWVDYDRVVFKGKIYTVRSFSGLVPEMTTGIINSGSTFFFNQVDWNDDQITESIETEEMLVLLASSPYDIVDKQRNRFIDVTSVTATQNPFGFYYDSGEFYALESIVQTVYPFIRSV